METSEAPVRTVSTLLDMSSLHYVEMIWHAYAVLANSSNECRK